jgi:hypothetical protein
LCCVVPWEATLPPLGLLGARPTFHVLILEVPDIFRGLSVILDVDPACPAQRAAVSFAKVTRMRNTWTT